MENDNVKLFLENKIAECELLIKKRRKKYKTVRALYVALITLSIVGNSTVLVLSAISVPPLVVLCLSAVKTNTSNEELIFWRNSFLSNYIIKSRPRHEFTITIDFNNRITIPGYSPITKLTPKIIS